MRRVERIERYIAEAEAAGTEVLLDGRSWNGAQPGHYIGPTILLHSSSEDPAMQDEIFGTLSRHLCATLSTADVQATVGWQGRCCR